MAAKFGSSGRTEFVLSGTGEWHWDKKDVLGSYALVRSYSKIIPNNQDFKTHSGYSVQ